MQVVAIEHVEVRSDRIVAQTIVFDERFAHTSPQLIAALIPSYPNLCNHTCVNGVGETFGAVANDTSLPHLIEHMAIENQANAGVAQEEKESAISYNGISYIGKSYWVDRDSLKACIELSYANDLVALAALRDAVRDVNQAATKLLGTCAHG